MAAYLENDTLQCSLWGASSIVSKLILRSTPRQLLHADTRTTVERPLRMSQDITQSVEAHNTLPYDGERAGRVSNKSIQILRTLRH